MSLIVHTRHAHRIISAPFTVFTANDADDPKATCLSTTYIVDAADGSEMMIEFMELRSELSRSFAPIA